MKQYTHAWLAYMAIKRLKEVKDKLSDKNRIPAEDLIKWFMNHKDDVTQGAWYPDFVIKDMGNSHVLKITPSAVGNSNFRKLPSTYKNYEYGKNSPLWGQPYQVDKNDNLPDRSDAISHSIIDNLKIQESEDKGSSVSPTDNHIALLLFMLSHYIADAHVPFHCDSRKFSKGKDIHGHLEGIWDDEIELHFEIDKPNERFFYEGDYPKRDLTKDAGYQTSYLKTVEDSISNRKFLIGYGDGNNNVWDFMKAICQYSYLLSYVFIPQSYNHNTVDKNNFDSLGNISLHDLSVTVLSDAIDSIARVWLRVWRRYMEWLTD
jgi:hypothetical protein